MSWRPKTLLINKENGKMLLVVRSYLGATTVTDPTDKQNPTPTYTLFERDYHHWVDEKKMQVKEKKSSWYDEPILTFKLAVAL